MRLRWSSYRDALTVEDFFPVDNDRRVPVYLLVRYSRNITVLIDYSPDAVNLPARQLSGELSGQTVAEIVNVKLYFTHG